VAVCPRFTVVLHCAVRDQALGWPIVQGILTKCLKDSQFQKSTVNRSRPKGLISERATATTATLGL